MVIFFLCTMELIKPDKLRVIAVLSKVACANYDLGRRKLRTAVALQLCRRKI